MDAEQIIAFIGALGIGTWVGNVIQKYIETKSNEKLKRLENEGGADKQSIKDLESDIEHLTDQKEKLKLLVTELKQQVSQLEQSLVTAHGKSARTEQQLATINVAFDMIYSQLRRMVGDRADGQELLEQLKTYIEGNANRNIT